MNIRTTLLEAKTQSRTVADQVADFACFSDENFQELLDCFISDDYRLAQRAAWSVSLAGKTRPDLILENLSVLINQLQRKNVHDAVIRNTVRILEDVPLPETFHGEVMDACFRFVQERPTPVAIKAFSLTILFNLSKIYPEIKNELRVIIEENIDLETPAVRSRGKKILASLRKKSV
jgi:hypothetical protein